MPSTANLTQSPRKDLHVFYLLDTSGSMEGAKINALNHAMEECTEALKEVAKKNGDANLKIAAMEFNTDISWITENGPEDAEDFVWDYVEAGGMTQVGEALDELNDKLSRNGFLQSMTGALMPVIIFMSDGYPTDEYLDALEEIRKNKWFRRAIKIGFAIGEDDEVDIPMISSVVGNSEAVIKTTDLDLFKRLIKFVSVTSSMLASKSQTSSTLTTGADIVSMAKQDAGLTDDDVANLSKDQYNPEPETTKADDSWDESWD